MSVGIIGARGTGKTVFVSLLATTAMNYSVETKYHFRYWTSPKFTPIIQECSASLKLRKWPPATLKNSLIGYKFWFAYSRKFCGILNTLYDNLEELSEAIKKLETPRKALYNIIEFNLYNLTEDVDIIFRTASLVKEKGTSIFDELPENLKAVLDCDVLVFLIDSSRITTDNTDPRYKEMLDYDGLMANLIILVAVYRSRKYRSKADKLFPVFVFIFTKFDTVDKKILNTIGISESIDRWLIEKDRKEIAERLTGFMGRFYQHTLAFVYGGPIFDAPIKRPEFFVSYLMPELSEEGIPVPKVVKASDGVSYDLVYSRSEYIRFIEYFGKIANEIKKTYKEPTEPVTGLGR